MSDLVRNPEDRFFRVAVHKKVVNLVRKYNLGNLKIIIPEKLKYT